MTPTWQTAELIPTTAGKFEIHLTEGAVITSRDELGMSKEEAEEILDEMQRRNQLGELK